MSECPKRSEVDGVELALSAHAERRMDGRRINAAAVQLVLRHGRCRFVRGAAIYLIGRKEVEKNRSTGLDLAQLAGVHVVCLRGGAILTVYRNHDFRGDRPGRRGRYPRPASADEILRPCFERNRHRNSSHFPPGA